MSRQTTVTTVIPAIGAVFVAGWLSFARGPQMTGEPRAPKGSFAVTKSDTEWQASLTPKQYAILRRHDTEYPGTSPLLEEHRAGTFVCAGCGQTLFLSDTKYESGSGWPSFHAAVDGAVGSSEDGTLGMRRVEIHCSRCGGHLGHVFTDGPKPTGLRYCTNGAALTFKPAGAQ